MLQLEKPARHNTHHRQSKPRRLGDLDWSKAGRSMSQAGKTALAKERQVDGAHSLEGVHVGSSPLDPGLAWPVASSVH